MEHRGTVRLDPLSNPPLIALGSGPGGWGRAMTGASGEVGTAGSAFTEGPSVHRRLKQRARLLTEEELVGKYGVAIPLDAVRQEVVLGGVTGGYDDLEDLEDPEPHKRPRVSEQAGPAHNRPSRGNVIDAVPDADYDSAPEDGDITDIAFVSSLPLGNEEIRAAPIFVAVKAMTPLDDLVGRSAPPPTSALLDPSSTRSRVVWAGERPRRAEEALLAGGWGPPRTHDFKGGGGGGGATPMKGAATPSVQATQRVTKVKRKSAPQPAVPSPNHWPSRTLPRLLMRGGLSCSISESHAIFTPNSWHTRKRAVFHTTTHPRGGGRLDTRGRWHPPRRRGIRRCGIRWRMRSRRVRLILGLRRNRRMSSVLTSKTSRFLSLSLPLSSSFFFSLSRSLALWLSGPLAFWLSLSLSRFLCCSLSIPLAFFFLSFFLSLFQTRGVSSVETTKNRLFLLLSILEMKN